MSKWPYYAIGVLTGIMCGLTLNWINTLFEGARPNAMLVGRVILGILIGLIFSTVISTLIEENGKKKPKIPGSM